jgi:hypothetical protein
MRRAGDTDGFEVAAGIWGGANKGNSCGNSVKRSDIRSEIACAYRTFKLGTLASATFDNILDADVCIAKLLLVLGSSALCSFVAAVAIHVVAVRIGLAKC